MKKPTGIQKDKPSRWGGRILRNVNTGTLYQVDYVFRNGVRLRKVLGEELDPGLLWNYKNVRRYFEEVETPTMA